MNHLVKDQIQFNPCSLYHQGLQSVLLLFNFNLAFNLVSSSVCFCWAKLIYWEIDSLLSSSSSLILTKIMSLVYFASREFIFSFVFLSILTPWLTCNHNQSIQTLIMYLGLSFDLFSSLAHFSLLIICQQFTFLFVFFLDNSDLPSVKGYNQTVIWSTIENNTISFHLNLPIHDKSKH